VSYRLLTKCDDLVFHALNERLCFLSFRVGRKRFVLFACYFPTSWAIDDEIHHVYKILRFFLAMPFEVGKFRWSAVISMLALARLKSVTMWNSLVRAVWEKGVNEETL